MIGRRLVPFVFALLLLFAQQTAFTHAAWHAHERAPVQSQKQGDFSLHGELCGLHGAFHQVLGTATAHAPSLAAQEAVASAVAQSAAASIPITHHAPLSRGPPRVS